MISTVANAATTTTSVPFSSRLPDSCVARLGRRTDGVFVGAGCGRALALMWATSTLWLKYRPPPVSSIPPGRRVLTALSSTTPAAHGPDFQPDHLSRADGAARSSGRYSSTVAVNVLPERRAVTAPDTVSVSVVIPCLNEEDSIGQCVSAARRVLDEHALDGEVLVVDNGSDDNSANLARFAGARVVEEPRRGYGSAYLAGFAAARGDYIVMIDADLTYDFEEIPRFVQELDNGAELVMGNRMGAVQPGAMSMLSRIGNPLLSGFLNLLFRTPVSDAHCGMRALRRDVLPTLALQATGMELASEMVIRASRGGLEIRELPIALHTREGESKLSPFRDGWRHLRLMLVYHPNFLFLFPGVLVGAIGVLLMGVVFAHASVFGREFYVAHADRRIAAGRRRHAARRVRSLRPFLCRVPARRPRSVVRADREPRPPRARSAARPRGDAGRFRARCGGRRPLDRGRSRQPRRGAGDDPRRDARHRRRPDLLHVVPALADRAAAPRPRHLARAQLPQRRSPGILRIPWVGATSTSFPSRSRARMRPVPANEAGTTA